MTIKQALLRVTPWTICQCVTGPMQRDNRQSALLLMHIHWEPLCLHCVGSQSRAWNSKTPLLKPCFAQITNLNCRLSTLPTLEQAVFSLILCQLLLRIKEWEVWRRNSDETRKQLQAEWMLLQSVWLIDWFFLVCLVFFFIITGQQFHLKWWRQNGTWQTVFYIDWLSECFMQGAST